MHRPTNTAHSVPDGLSTTVYVCVAIESVLYMNVWANASMCFPKRLKDLWRIAHRTQTLMLPGMLTEILTPIFSSILWIVVHMSKGKDLDMWDLHLRRRICLLTLASTWFVKEQCCFYMSVDLEAIFMLLSVYRGHVFIEQCVDLSVVCKGKML